MTFSGGFCWGVYSDTVQIKIASKLAAIFDCKIAISSEISVYGRSCV